MEIAVLEAARQRSDETADLLVKSLFQAYGPKQVGQLFHKYINSLEEVDLTEIPPLLGEYFNEQQHLPEWADIQKIEEAESVFLKMGPEYALSLLCRALPVGYTALNTVKVLTSTGYLSSDVKTGTAKRLLETTQFILDVMSPGALHKGSRGIKSILKVRFIHAMVRYQLQRHQWDAEKHGIPINQEDMSGTILTFSIGAIMGMDRLHQKLTAGERDALVHFWSVVGHVIGVEAGLNPSNYADARMLYETILEHQAAYSEDGEKLTRALSNFVTAVLDLPVMPHTSDYIIRYLIHNERYSNLLRLKRPETIVEKMVFEGFLKGLKTLNRYRHVPFASSVTRPMNRYLTTRLLQYFATEFQMKLSIPQEIRHHWGVADENGSHQRPAQAVGQFLSAGLSAFAGKTPKQSADV